MQKQLNLKLFPPVTEPTIRDIQIATRGLDLFDPDNVYKIVEAVSKCYEIDIMNIPGNTKGIKEFMAQCYENALIANTAYNSDKE